MVEPLNFSVMCSSRSWSFVITQRNTKKTNIFLHEAISGGGPSKLTRKKRTMGTNMCVAKKLKSTQRSACYMIILKASVASRNSRDLWRNSASIQNWFSNKKALSIVVLWIAYIIKMSIACQNGFYNNKEYGNWYILPLPHISSWY